MASPDFSEFSKPTTAGKPGMVVCVDCRREMAKQQARFEARETGYLCHSCGAARRRRFLAKVGAVAAGTIGTIVWLVYRVTR